jgi:hypothetical protein
MLLHLQGLYPPTGVQLGPLSTAATNRHIVPALGDYDDGKIGGMMIGRGNRRTRRKPAPVPLCPPQTTHAYPGRRGGMPATNRLSYDTAMNLQDYTVSLARRTYLKAQLVCCTFGGIVLHIGE